MCVTMRSGPYAVKVGTSLRRRTRRRDSCVDAEDGAGGHGSCVRPGARWLRMQGEERLWGAL